MPIMTPQPASAAAVHSASVAGPGTSTALATSRVKASLAGSWSQSAAPGETSIQIGNPGSHVSGKTANCAPLAPASAMSRHAFSTEASRSMNTGAAWTAATL